MKLTEFYTLPTDCAATCPSDYLAAMAAAGETHMALCGQTMEDLLRRGESMMISRTALRFVQPTVRPTTVRTRQIAARGVRAERLFQFFCGDELVAEGINEYFCVNLETRRAIRVDWFAQTGEPYDGECQLCRIPMPESGKPIAEHTVADECVDYNGHLNNRFYCDYAMEALGRTDFPRELYIQYLHEMLPHTAFTLHRSADGCVAYGKQGDSVTFTALCVD